MQGPRGKNQLRISKARRDVITTTVHMHEAVKRDKTKEKEKTGEDSLGPGRAQGRAEFLVQLLKMEKQIGRCILR